MSVYENLINQFGFDYEFLPDKPVNDIREISDDTVVCYDPQGKPVYYGAKMWNCKAICPASQTIYNFGEFPSLEGELKKIIYARLFFSPKSRSVSSVRQTSINHVAKWASNNNCSIERMLNDHRLFPFVAESYSNLTPRSASILLSMIRELRKIRVIHPEFSIGPEDDTLSNLLDGTPVEAKSDFLDTNEQTPVIPSRIFSNLITGFEEILSLYYENCEAIESFYSEIIIHYREDNGLAVRTNFDEFLQRHYLFDYAQKYGIRSKKTFNAHLGDIQNISRYWIHFFTGMRRNEVDTLAYGCTDSITSHGVQTKIVRGLTSKLTSQAATPSFWVTTDIIDSGIEAARSVARVFAAEKGYVVDDVEFPLFPSSQPKMINGEEVSRQLYKNAPYVMAYQKSEFVKRVLSKIPSIFIREEDIRELELFDGFRNWREKFPVGKPWPLETHQCRRSLAVYLARSGRVSLGAMQSQFKHLCAAMTSYYRRGSTFAVNFLEDDDAHTDQLVFVDSLEKEQRLAQYLNYEAKVIDNQSNLWGGEGKRIKRAYNRGQPLVIVSDRKETQERFERGEMVYKESPLGGCTKIGSCDRLSITNITPCVDCEHSVLDETSLPKIQRQLSHLETERDQYEPGSLFYQHTQNEIDELNRKLRKN